MSILRDMLTAVRGGAREVGDAVVDANAVRILEQEVVDAEDAIRKAKGSLRNIKSSEIKLAREIAALKSEIEDYESSAVEALNAGKEDLAVEVAERIGELESELEDKAGSHHNVSSQVKELYAIITGRERAIGKSKRELEQVKTVKSLQKATAALSTNMAAGSSSANRVSRALERVKKKQSNWKDQMAAGDWMADQDAGGDLKSKLKAEGIGEKSKSAQDILARLKKKH